MKPIISASEEPAASNWDWADRGTPHVSFSKDEPLPFQEGDILGHGASGQVTQTVIKGVRVALKKIHCRRGVRQKDLQEIKIMRKLKHPHIIQLVGSYTHEECLGILLYPVATCDLRTFLEDVDFLQRFEKNLSNSPGISSSEIEKRISRCATISRIKIGQQDRVAILSDVTNAARARIWESYGCITSAVSYLHQSSIKHKDIKSLNILLSHDGLWITDFGQSTDFSEFSDSATTGGERGTIKYCAPEVATSRSSRRSADVFSLGCMFFEMAALRCFTFKHMEGLRPSVDRSFHNNLDEIFEVFEDFEDFGNTALENLPMSLVKRMLSKNPTDRPDLASISRELGLLQAFSTIEPETFASIQCPHHTSPPVFDSQLRDFAFEELLITIGNTSGEETGKFKHKEFPVEVFVKCSSVDCIDTVIFFQHSSASSPSSFISKTPFARRSTIWGTYTQAVLIVLKPGYYWCSQLASLVPWGAPGSYQSALPMTWELQVADIDTSKTTRVPVYSEHHSGS